MNLTTVIFVIMAVLSIVLVPLLLLVGPPGWFLLCIWFAVMGNCIPHELSEWLGERALKRRGGGPSKQQLWEEKMRKETQEYTRRRNFR